jgi:hypothetical protein
MKRILCWVMVAGFVASCFATDARVLTMGRHDDFFMDDISIFRNPANVNYYPNMLMGSLGIYVEDSTLDHSSNNYAALVRNNRDPQKPFAGAILSYSLNQSSEGGNQYPLLSIGALFNRYDYMLDYLNPASAKFSQAFGANPIMLDPSVGKLDLIIGYAFPSGGMVGVGGYFAFQDEKRQDIQFTSNLYKGNVGINWPLAKSMNLEVSMDISSVKGAGIAKGIGVDTTSSSVYIANGDISWKGDIRLFSALTSFNGDFVPHLGIENISLLQGKYNAMSVAGGLGININIDKGFFWAGLEGLYESKDLKPTNITGWAHDSSSSGIGGRVSAGLERNVIFDWWVWRIGVMKRLMYVTSGGNNGSWEQNPEADASDDDFISFGWGLNIENRFKVDVVMAEDIFYTWTNLISGPMHHLTNRITATYSF